ncbi:MAG: hypothetical protein Kow0080_08780 [Candidatus Promineifilaceae bacterium]
MFTSVKFLAMNNFYVFVIRNDVWIYILAGLGLVWYISEFLRGQRILQRAVFGLERETGSRIRNTAVIFILLFTSVIGTVVYVNSQIAPVLPQELLRPPTPTPNIFQTPLASPSPINPVGVEDVPPQPAVVATITLPGNAAPLLFETAVSGQPTPTYTPSGPTPTPFIACTTNLNIQEPHDGAFVSGVLAFTGTADTPNFGYYSLEANGPQTSGQWASLLGRTITQPVRDGFLGNVNLSQWGNGPYLIRLTAVDASGNLTGQCVIQVTLNN